MTQSAAIQQHEASQAAKSRSFYISNIQNIDVARELDATLNGIVKVLCRGCYEKSATASVKKERIKPLWSVTILNLLLDSKNQRFFGDGYSIQKTVHKK